MRCRGLVGRRRDAEDQRASDRPPEAPLILGPAEAARRVRANEWPGLAARTVGHAHCATGLEVVVISRRLGHATRTINLKTDAHLWKRDGSRAASAIEAAMRTGVEH